MAVNVKFYYTLGCHLCEMAEAMLLQESVRGVAVDGIDIADHDALIERYGVRIPVVQRLTDGAELDWPFEAERLRRFLGD